MCRKYYAQVVLLCFVLMKAECNDDLMMTSTTPKEMIRERYVPPLDTPTPANITITIDAQANDPQPNNASAIQREVVFDLHSNHTILCTANEPVRWLMRTATTSNVLASNVTVKGWSHAISLQINGTMHENGGYYHCVRAIKLKDISEPSELHLATFSEMVKRRDAGRLYVHVNDEDNMLVPIDVHEVHAFQYGDLIIPCRRTVPNIRVQLKALRRNNGNNSNYSSDNNNNNNGNHSSSGSGNHHTTTNAVDATTDNYYTVIATSSQRWHRQNYPPDNIYTSIEYDPELGFIIRHVLQLSEHFVCETAALNTTSHAVSTAEFRVHLLGFIYQNESVVIEQYAIDDVARKDVNITVDYLGALWPDTNVSWTQEGKGVIVPSATRRIISGDSHTTLTIRNAHLEDNAQYTLTLRYQLMSKSFHFNVTISDMPKVNVSDKIVGGGSFAQLTCRTVAHPKASVTWLYRPCLEPCNATFERFDHHVTARPGSTPFEYLHDIIFKPPATGVLRCEALNELGNQTGDGNVFISTEQENLRVTLMNEDIVIGDDVRLTCAARYYMYENELVWYKDDQVVQNDTGITEEDTSTKYEYRRVLTIKNIALSNSGRYTCMARGTPGEYDGKEVTRYDKRSIDVKVHAPQAPRFNATNLRTDMPFERKLGESLELVCKATPISRADVIWYKEDEIVNSTNEQMRLSDNNRRLTIDYLRPGDEGNYKCMLHNSLGEDEATAEVLITDLPASLSKDWIIGIVLFCIALVLLVIYLSISVFRERRLANELKAAGLALFEEGDLSSFNPLLSLGEQADLLPYDRRFEFPREKLKLGRQLGAGTFGVVYEAHAEGILPDESETCVAVKMVKRGADNETLRALVTELKILIHIGRHLNVVNLLGAVTQEIAKRELMVIVEHCPYGNLKDFLLKNREYFVDQIDPNTDSINVSIMGQQTLQSTLGNVNSGYQSWSSSGLLQSNDVKTISTSLSGNYLQVSSLDSDKQNNTGNYLQVSSLDSDKQNNTTTTSVASSLNNNTITTSDLVSWAFQVARGMDYLASVRVVHGDLAARNLLLCPDNVVKICDFGLAHSLYKEDYYKKRGEGLLPFKWLSPESLSDNIFDVHTDVWSFGIMMWELFSLARVPYPGLEPNVHLYEKLRSGYRMEKPLFANDELYDIMLDCWNELPKERPLFNELEQKFSRILGEEVTNHYITLSENNYFTRSNSLPYMKKVLSDQKGNDYVILDKKQTKAFEENIM